jgi:hypothetical protein
LPLEFHVDDRAVQAALRRVPRQAGTAVRKGMQVFATDTVRAFTRARLSATDDRVAIPELGGLGIRPPASPGLVRRTGSLARAFLSTTIGNSLDTLKTTIGFLNPFAARIARVHELGTIGKGGVLPDITGRLAVPIRSLGAAFGKAKGMILLRKVSIPPRLGFLKFAKAALRSGRLEKAIAAQVKKALEGRAA